ncbi:hypothetical protein [Arthrobacter sp. M4]|uniref:hypothetical protein n=1 Tax=Arthrobacter sp. M4 TaxID=218160 RepID=UPI001CDBEF69|nr:hypothetical protein [Arthrobacter sp. M4]MCA4131932.1 hypothetical protein [Arthrobacter sp. M4]
MRREDEPEEFEIADSYFQELRTWLGFRDSYEAWIPEAGSRLAQDDGLIKPHQASHNIANAVVSAIDHLHALDRQHHDWCRSIAYSCPVLAGQGSH